jgi:prevent-host-death family protein
MATSRPIGVVNARDLGRNTGEILDQVEDLGAYVLVTRRGRPAALVSPISQDSLEDFILANAPEFVEGMAEADRELAAGETKSLQGFLDEELIVRGDDYVSDEVEAKTD